MRIAGETGHWDTIPDSEPSKEFRRRVVDAFDEIASKHRGERVIAFAHGGVVNAYAAETLGLERDFFFPAANTSITVIKVLEKVHGPITEGRIIKVTRLSETAGVTEAYRLVIGR